MIRFALALLLAVSSFSTQAQNAIPAPPELAAKAYFLIDANSGAVLVEHNADVQLAPASLTKMMTAYVLAEEIKAGRVKEDDMVKITENCSRYFEQHHEAVRFEEVRSPCVTPS